MQTYEEALQRVNETRTRKQRSTILHMSRPDWERLWEAIKPTVFRGFGWTAEVCQHNIVGILAISLWYAMDDFGAFDVLNDLEDEEEDEDDND